MAEGIVDQLLGQLDKANTEFVTKGYQALVNGCGSMMTTIIVIYIAWIGWKTINHWEGFSAGNFVKQVLKIAVIYSLATDWAFFSTYLYNVLTNGPDELSKMLMGAAGSHYDSNNSALNDLFLQGLATGKTMWDKSGLLSGLLGCILAVDIWVLTILVVAIAIVMIGVAKVFLAMLIVMTPIFVYFLFTDTFKAITESWFKMTLGFALVPLFVNTALLYTNDMLKKAIEFVHKSIVDGAAVNSISAIASFDISMILCAILLWKSADLAAQIGGGMAVKGLDQIGNAASKLGGGEMMKAVTQSLRSKMAGGGSSGGTTGGSGGGSGRWGSVGNAIKDKIAGTFKDAAGTVSSMPSKSGGGSSGGSAGTFDGGSGSSGNAAGGQSTAGSVIGGSAGDSGASSSGAGSALGKSSGNAAPAASAKQKAIRKRSYDRKQKIVKAQLAKSQRTTKILK